MSKESIVERIISDAEREAENIVAQAEARAKKTTEDGVIRCDRRLTGVKAESAERVESILEGKAATARLDGAKILLEEKLRVIDYVYNSALDALNKLDEKASLDLAERLLLSYAEEGDEIIFAQNYKYCANVATLPAVKKMKLKVSDKKREISGGFVLKGKTSDKDLSYGALLAHDREEHQAAIAATLFKD